MNDLLTLTEIIKLFGREIYLKGKELYENNAVKNLIEDGNYLKGSVLDNEKTYNTLIKLEYDSNPKIMKCDCMIDFFCRHSCASLIFYIKNGPKEKLVLKNPLKKTSLINDNQDQEWLIEISMMNIKSGNKIGKIVKFEEEKITESLNKEEREIFIRLYDKKNFSDSLIYYLNYLVNNNSKILFYLNNNGNYIKLKIIEIKIISINFVFYNYDLKTNEILFIPEIIFEDINGVCTSSLQIDHYPVYNGEVLGVIINDGTLLFKKFNTEKSIFIGKILLYNDRYNISEIEYLKSFVENNFNNEVKINFNVIEIIKRNEEDENKIKDFLLYILKDELLKINKNRNWNNEINYDLLLKC